MRHAARHPDPFADPSERHWSHWLTRAALIIAVAVVFARATTLETIRNPLDVLPGSANVPSGTGPAEGLWLDVLALLPALLVLGRRVLDPKYVLRCAWSAVPMLLLGAWAVLSTAWAADKFAAIVSSMHWFAAMGFLWSIMQLVTSWVRLRLVSAACFGLLIVLVAQGFYYRLVELPDLRAEWARNGQTILKERGWEPGSFEAKQFENRVLSGEMLGFTSSPNSFAAVLVLLGAISAGVLAQTISRREGFGPDVAKGSWLPCLLLGGILLASLAIVWFTHSRTAAAMAFLAAMIIGTLPALRSLLAQHAGKAYAVGVALFIAGTAAIVAYGLRHGTLIHISLTFRWRYWVGAAGAFAANPLRGVGWENFGTAYLTHRLPIAAEEVRDPHDFIVRIFTELGMIGGALLLAWQLRLWWELTRPRMFGETTTPTGPPASADGETDEPRSWGSAKPKRFADSTHSVSAIATAATIGVLGLLLSIAVGIDLTQGAAFVTIELLRRGEFLCLFVLGMTAASIRSVEEKEIDATPAPWLEYGLLVGAGVFLIHNLVDFSLFEPGPLFMFALATGAALGARSIPNPRKSAGMPITRVALAMGVLLWIGLVAMIAVPVTIAEGFADEGDLAVRNNQLRKAASLFETAAGRVPYNADYSFRAAQSTAWYGGNADALLDQAIMADPKSVKYVLFRARVGMMSPAPSWPRVLADFDRALSIDPCNVPARLDYAQALRRSGDLAAARVQFERALSFDDQLAPDEPERLKQDRVAQIRQTIDTLPK